MMLLVHRPRSTLPPAVRPVARRVLGTALAGAMTVAALPAPAAGSANRPAEPGTVVSDWNSIAMTTLLGDPGKAAQETLLYLAFVHAAIYDAVVGVHGRYQPYAFHGHAPRGTSAVAATAAAAHRILTTYSPYARGTLDADLAASLAAVPDGRGKAAGVAFGDAAAERLISLRTGDGRNAPIEYTKAPGPGIWRPTPPAFAPMAVPWLGGVRPLLIHDTARFAPPAPPGLTSGRYTRDFAEVKAMGSATSAQRTAGQTATALFFSGNAAVQFNTALRDQITTRRLDIVDAARMTAAVDMTVADALIVAWQAKLTYGVWRPSTAIQLAGTDGNPATAADPSWTPLLVNPPYPDYVSGYNTVAAAGSRALEHVVGRRPLELTLTSTAVPGAVREYDTGSALRTDVVDARIWLGIHFRSADVAARNLGVSLADWSLAHYFRPVARHR